jgi:outer membrane protein assembly factor BamB
VLRICLKLTLIIVFAIPCLCLGQASISLSSKGGPPTSSLRVSGSGFTPGAQINIYFDVKDEALVIADGTGSFSDVKIEVMPSAAPGKHWVSAVQRSGYTGAQSPFWVHTDWAQMGFAPAHSWSNPYENVLSPRTVRQLSLEWSTTLAPSDAVDAVNNFLYISSGDSVYALNALNGNSLWQYSTGAPVTATPAVDGKMLFVGSNDFNVYALTTSTGSLVWKYTTGSYVVSSPTVANGVVYACSDDDNIYALNENDGSLLWTFATAGPIQFAPSVSNGIVYVASSDGNIYALSASTGALVWQYTTTPKYNSTTPSVVNGVVYVASADSNLYALNSSNGSLLWKTNLGAPADGSFAAVANGMVYLGSGDGGVFYALDANTGAVRWQYTTRVPVYSASAVADGVVYFGDGNGFFNAFDALSGKLLWRYVTGRFFPEGVVTNGRVYLSGDLLYAFDVPGENSSTAQPPDMRNLRP